MVQQLNLDLLTQGQDLTDQLIETLDLLKYQTRFNSDENTVFEDAIRYLKSLSISLDGVFYRTDSNVDVVRPATPKFANLERIIQIPDVLPPSKQRKTG